MKKTFEIAKKEISEKYPYLELLEFNGNDKKALFLDKDYGEFEGNYRSVLRGHKNHKDRAKINKRNKTKQTNLKKYGVENPFQSEEIKYKIKKTCLEKYGVEHHLQNYKILEKRKQSNIGRYGVDHPFKLDKFKNKYKQTNLKKYGVEHNSQIPFVKENKKITYLKKYGVENPSQIQEIKNKKIQTSLKNFNVKYPLQSNKVKEKSKKSNLEKYGVEYPAQNKEIYNKVKQTNLKKYGAEYTIQSKEIQKKIKEIVLEKYGVENILQSKEIQKKIKQTNLNNNNWHNINGMSLREYHNQCNIGVAYSTMQQNFKKYGKVALKKNHYNLLHGKSKIADLWLESIEKELGYSLIREHHIPTTLYRADGYDPKTNTIYEFYGDYWHGNLNKFSANDIHPIKDKTFQELYNDTIKKENKIKSLGYNIISIWENDFKMT